MNFGYKTQLFQQWGTEPQPQMPDSRLMTLGLRL